MKLLLRYLLRELLVPLVVWVAFLFLLLLVMYFLRAPDVLLGSAVTAEDLGKFTLYLAPKFLQHALPVALLLAILLGIGRLSEDSELTAMQAMGVGPLRILAAPIAIGLVLGGAMLFLGFRAAPWGLRMGKTAINEVIKKNLVGDVKPGVFYEDLTDLTMYVQKVRESDGQWTNVLVHDARDQANPLLVLAREGEVNAEGTAEGFRLTLTDGDVHRANRSTSEYTTIDFERGELVVGLSDSFFRKNKFRSPKEELSSRELLQAAGQAREGGEAPEPFLMAYQWRWGQALMPVAFAVMGTPLAMSRRGSGRARGYLLTIGGYILYYVLARTCVSLGEHGRLPTLLAGQLPNVVFAALGVWALVRVSRAGTVR